MQPATTVFLPFVVTRKSKMANSTPNNATATARINSKKQTLDDAYAPPANFLEIDVLDSQTHGVGKNRYTDYEVRMRVCSDDLFSKFPSTQEDPPPFRTNMSFTNYRN